MTAILLSNNINARNLIENVFFIYIIVNKKLLFLLFTI